jgi:diguanylate cyclase (GGDEF)-like protein
MFSKDEPSQFNVLIVEDDPVVLNLLTHLLEMGRYRVRSASDGNQALQMVLQDCPDVLITELHVTGLDGLELCRRVRQLHSRKVIPHYSYILILTDQYNRDAIVEGLEAGVDNFIERDISSLSNFRTEIQARFNAALRIRKLEIELDQAAKYDSLTRLLNRVAFFETAQIHWDRSIRNKAPLAAVMMDCDLFKRVNDIYGHMVGDTVLKELAAILRSFSRTSDVICRYGGEEFCAILPGCNEKVAWEWADRIRQRCAAIPIRHADIDISTTVSFGVAERTESTILFDQLVERADQALLAAKEWGRNRSISYSEVLAHAACETGHFASLLCDNVTAKDVMVPFPLSIHPHDSVATVANYFLKTQFESLPIIDYEGKLIGVVSETDLFAMIGQQEQWVSPVKNFILPNVVSYPTETPLRKIVDFLSRTSIRRVMIFQDVALVGYIDRTLLLRWLRNQWAVKSGKHSDIIPDVPEQKTLVHNLHIAVEGLREELTNLDSFATESDADFEFHDRGRMVSMVSQ